MERLVNERSIALGYSLDASSFGAYTSALNSYLTFCNLHHLPVDPTPDTLSFYVVFLSTYIKPDSVNAYLSGICRQLELGIVTGYPGVFQGNPHPYPRKPAPAARGAVFGGYGCGFNKNRGFL